MFKNIKSLILLIWPLIIFSCHKKSTPPSPSALIIGNWKTTREVSDANGNGLIDASDPVSTPPDNGFDNIFCTFSNDGTGMQTDSIRTTINLAGRDTTLISLFHKQLKWSLQDNDTYLQLIVTDTSGGNAKVTTSYLRIDSITSSSLALRDTCLSCHPASAIIWNFFTRE